MKQTFPFHPTHSSLHFTVSLILITTSKIQIKFENITHNTKQHIKQVTRNIQVVRNQTTYERMNQNVVSHRERTISWQN